MCKQIYIYVKFLSIRIKCQTFCSVLKIYVQFYTYLFIMEPNLAPEQYPCKCTESFFKKSCFLSCFTEIYSPLKKIHKSHSPLFPDTFRCSLFTQNFKSVPNQFFGQRINLFVITIVSFFFFSPGVTRLFHQFFSDFLEKKEKKEKTQCKSILNGRSEKPFPQNLIDPSVISP